MRSNGESQPPYNGLNLGAHVGDVPSAVIANRTCLQTSMGMPEQPVWLDQTHSSKVVDLAEEFLLSECPLPADGSFTRKTDQICTVMTADCLPLLLTDRAGSFVAAIHVGWRGMADGIIEQAIKAIECDVSQILAWAGPCIGASHFEVGLEVKTRLGGADSAYRPHPDNTKIYADLTELAKQRLHNKGIRGFYSADLCTYTDSQRFFSYRRDGITGRMATFIWITQ